MLLALVLLTAGVVHGDSHDSEVQAKIESLACGDAMVGHRLSEEIRIHSRRDLGWRFFPEDKYIDAERGLRVSKSMEIRYRWRIDGNGRILPESDAAKKLCQ